MSLIKAKVLLLIVWLPSSLAFSAPKIEVTVQLKWKYVDLPEQMEVYEPAVEGRIWEMGEGQSISDLPIKGKLSEIKMSPGQRRALVLVYRNTTTQPFHFFAAPHSVEPASAALGFKFKCLCVDHVFSVKPGKYWYRITEMKLSETFSRNRLEVTHSLIRVDEKTKLEHHAALKVD